MKPATAVTLLTSLDPLLRESVLARLRVDRPDVALLRHDVDLAATEGVVVRRIISGTRTEEHRLPLSSGCCLTCLIREDMLDVARSGFTQHLVAVVPAALDPLAFAMLLAHAGDHDIPALEGSSGLLLGVVAVVRSETLESLIRSVGPPDPGMVEGLHAELDASELLLRQIEHADVVLHDRADERSSMLLASLADSARHFTLDVPPTEWLAHRSPSPGNTCWPTPLGATPPRTGGGLSSAHWLRRRPLHPQRFAEAIDQGLLGGLLRARGVVWVASRPTAVFEVSIAAESCALGAIDTWLDPLSDALTVPDVPPCPSQSVGGHQIEWDPYYGDRFQSLSLVSETEDLDALVAELDDCLLTDAELAEGPVAWRRIDDSLLGPEDGSERWP